MKMPKTNSQEKRILSYVTVAAIAFGAYFLRGYFSLIVIAGVLAYLFTPLYNWYKKRMSAGLSATFTLLTSIILVIVPLTLIFWFAANQLRSGVEDVGQQASNLDFGTIGTQVIDSVNNFLDNLPFGDFKITEASVIESGRNFVSTFGDVALKYFTNFAGSVFGVIASIVVYVYLFLAILINGPKLVGLFRELNPLGKDISDLYIDRTAAMVRGTVRGQFTIAAVQGLIGATTIAMAGLNSVFFVMFIILTLLSIVPLGGGILAIPIGVVLILFGNLTGGLIIILGHLLVTTNIDGVLRPILIPKQARLDAALMLISVFSGIAMFGFLGIILGPTVIILIVTTIRVYLMVHKGHPEDIEAQKKPGLYAKFSSYKNKTTKA